MASFASLPAGQSLTGGIWTPPSPKTSTARLSIAASAFVPSARRVPSHQEAVDAAVEIAKNQIAFYLLPKASQPALTMFIPPSPRVAASASPGLPPITDEWEDDMPEFDVDAPVFVPGSPQVTRYPAPRACPRSCPLPPREAPNTSFKYPAPIGSCTTLLSGLEGLDDMAPLDIGAPVSKSPRSGALLTRGRSSSQENKRNAAKNPFKTGGDFEFKPVKQGHTWRVYFEEGRGYGKGKKEKGMERSQFQSDIAMIGSCASWNDFSRRYGTAVPHGGTLYLFRGGIQPVWEDKANQGEGAGKWIIPTKSQEASVRLVREAVKAISTKKLAANGVLMTVKFGQAMVMLWMNGKRETSKEELFSMLGREGMCDTDRIRYKVHSPSKSQPKAIQVAPAEVDSDYDSSPVLGGQDGVLSKANFVLPKTKKKTRAKIMWADM